MAYDFNNPALGQLLASVLTGGGAALAAYGSGSPQWGFAGAQAASDYGRQQQQAKEQALRDKILQAQFQQQQDATALQKQREGAAKSFLLGQTPPPAGAYDGQGRPGPSAATPSALSTLPAAHADFYRSYAEVDPLGAAQMAGQELLKDPTKHDLQDFYTTDGKAYKGYLDPNTNQPVRVGDFYPRWQPAQPPAPPSDFILWQTDRKNDPTNPNFKTIADWRKYQQAGSTPKITTLYGPGGAIKSLYENDPGLPGMLQSGWTATAPATPKQPGIVTLFDGKGNSKAFYEGDPNIKPLLDTGWTDKAPAKTEAALANMTPEEVKTAGLPQGTVAQRDPITNKITVINKGSEGAGGTFDTKALEGQAWNIVLNPDSNPASPDYLAAWQILSMPKTTMQPDGTIYTVQPDLSKFRQPIAPGSAAPAVPAPATPTGPGIPAAQPAAPAIQPPQPPQPAPPVTGPGPASPVPSQSQSIPGATVTRVTGGNQTPADIQKLKEISSEVGSIKSALQDFKSVVEKAPETDFLNAYAGGAGEGGRKLSTAWSAAALQLKSQALLNLGVLNGPDLALIQNMLPNPTTLTGATIVTKKAYNAAIDQILRMIDEKVNAYTQQYGPKNSQAPAPAAAPSADELKKKYNITPVKP